MGRMVETHAGKKARLQLLVLVFGALDAAFFQCLTSNTKAAIVFVFFLAMRTC